MNEVDVNTITYYNADGTVKTNPAGKTGGDGSFWSNLGSTLGSLLGTFVGTKNQATVNQQNPYLPQYVNMGGQNSNNMMMIAIVAVIGIMFMMFMFMGKK